MVRQQLDSLVLDMRVVTQIEMPFFFIYFFFECIKNLLPRDHEREQDDPDIEEKGMEDFS